MCRHCGDDTCHGGCWSSFISCLKCLCRCCCDSDDDGHHENINNQTYHQSDKLPLMPKNTDSNSSNDQLEYWASGNPYSQPGDINGSEPPLNSAYNCWGWAISPISGTLKTWDPPDCQDATTIKEFSDKVFEYIKGIVGEKVEKLSKSQMQSRIQTIQQNQIVIALRTGNQISPDGKGVASTKISYHFAKYIYGQWSYKDGAPGVLVAYEVTTPALEPESIWKHHAGFVKNPGERKFIRDENGQIKNSLHYTSETVYFLITLN